MFFASPAVVIRVKRSVLELYLPPKNQFYKLDIPQNLLNFMDVVNEDNLVKYLLDFLIKLNLKSVNVDLVLDSEIVFEGTVAKTIEAGDKSAIDGFFSCVPLEPGGLVRKTYLSDNQYFLYATNRAYYNLIIRAFAKVGWRVNYVAPLSIFGFNSQNQVLTDENLKLVRNGKKLAEKVNFLEESQPEPK